VRLGERVLLAESLERLDESDWVDAIVVAAPPDWEEPVMLLADELACGKVVAAVSGGGTRAESVRAAMAEVPQDAAVALVHDAARPLLTDDVIGRVLAPLGEGYDGAVPVLPLVDTVKRVQGEEVVETLDRSELVAAQTPQAFVASVLRKALADDVSDATDCASLVERRGGRIKTVPGEARLLKVTGPEDLRTVEALL
jgi:2-C-methyl-D-erythritol 4-phosphate cytidylyltransferase